MQKHRVPRANVRPLTLEGPLQIGNRDFVPAFKLRHALVTSHIDEDAACREDTDVFDARIADALAAERRGSPSQALVHYEEACDLYGGEFLPGMDQESIVNERTRLRSVAHGALCRRGELVLARGEPETALALAAAALAKEIVDEHLRVDFFLNVERWRMDDEVAPVLLILRAPNELGIEGGVTLR